MFGRLVRKTPSKQIFTSAVRCYTNELDCAVSSSEFKELVDNFEPEQDIVFLDVREDEDTTDGFLPTYNSNGVKLRNIRIPILDLIEMQIHELEQYKDTHQIFVYCRGGNKSVAATRILDLHGYNTVNLKGGISKLKKVMDLWKQG
eukprot:CAMPEP_0168317840 /NCGR_PEP_ID=MMETSP0213-20121227/124_1 /TAXON_ID=151035 /ORGANISM="Euplotes harpa, Strain FSP1.4" /LENGTH=145 /DNA_ID=CAMNT_0008318795 /DNA_START=36 /DNA_END=473 /DNA_ORIENTATION=+